MDLIMNTKFLKKIPLFIHIHYFYYRWLIYNNLIQSHNFILIHQIGVINEKSKILMDYYLNLLILL